MLGSQKTAAEESGTVMSNYVKEEWILVILPSLVVFAGAKTRLSSACTRPGGEFLLITPGELGGV